LVAPAAKEGFVVPPWYDAGKRRRALAAMALAAPAPSGKGHLDRVIFRHYLSTRVYPRASVCFRGAVARNQVQAGRAVLEIEVGRGEVMAARLAEAAFREEDQELLRCLTEAAWSLEIPAAHRDERAYRLRYPLRFHAPEDGAPRTVGDPLGEGTIERLLELAPG
jgi:hypothetical protein